MKDMLVKLYTLPSPLATLEAQAALGVSIRKPIGPEHRVIVDWVLHEFGDAWASEIQTALGNRPTSCFIATQENQLVGFGCYDATARGMFGPLGVDPVARGRGTGTALLMACLDDMRSLGYAYAVIGSVGSPEFYRRSIGAVAIPDSSPGVYRDMLRQRPKRQDTPRAG